MGVYYISACHDCKERTMWTKCTHEKAEELHGSFHSDHQTEIGVDEDDRFTDRLKGYKDKGIKDG